LSRENYYGSQRHNFSGRLLANRDWDSIQRQLIDTSRWFGLEDLSWLSEQIEQDHALSRRVKELEMFFAEIREEAPPPVPVPDGYKAVFRLISASEQDKDRVPGRRSRRREAVDRLKAAEEEMEAQASKIRELKRKLQKQKARNARGSRARSLSKVAAYVRNRMLGK
jgi:hypothetical protein